MGRRRPPSRALPRQTAHRCAKRVASACRRRSATSVKVDLRSSMAALCAWTASDLRGSLRIRRDHTKQFVARRLAAQCLYLPAADPQPGTAHVHRSRDRSFVGRTKSGPQRYVLQLCVMSEARRPKPERVGIRELRQNLSVYVQRVPRRAAPSRSPSVASPSRG